MKLFFTLLALLLVADNAPAQLCTGSLGDPIVNINFGSGGNPGLSLGNKTSYTFQQADCPDDGKYTVINSTSNCFATWHSTGDHTQNGNGYMMLVNASFDPGIFYLDTVRGLCSNTTFEFSAWMINMLSPSGCGGNGIRPNITFQIESTSGTVLQLYNTGDINPTNNAQWKQYGFFFTTPPNVSDVVLKLINNAPGGCGNDLALDDISFRPCGLGITSSIENVVGNTAYVCSGIAKSFTLKGSVGSQYANPAFRWQKWDSGNWQDVEGATEIDYVVNFGQQTSVGNYKYRFVTAEGDNINSLKCRMQSPELVFVVQGSPIVDAGSDKVILAGDSVRLNGTVLGDSVAFTWLPAAQVSNANTLAPLVAPPSDAYFFLQATSLLNCGTKIDTVFVKVHPGLYVPTAFTPNQDGVNDVWNIGALMAFSEYEVLVFNRYGEKVFATKNHWNPWDGKHKGKLLESGAYIYYIKLPHRPLIKGTLMLLR